MAMASFTTFVCKSYASFHQSRGKAKRGRVLVRKMGLGTGKEGEDSSGGVYSELKSYVEFFQKYDLKYHSLESIISEHLLHNLSLWCNNSLTALR